jgi:mono/diheme cytochrome c family protein
MSATYYTVLGITETATAAEVKEAYRKLSETQHPDKGGDAERWKLITAAFNAAKNIAANRRGGFGNRPDQAWQRAWEALAPTAEAPKAKAAKEARTFDGNAVTEHECATCHTVKKVNAFPTVTGKGATGTGKRGVECRTCRDARTKAAKEAKDDAKAA